MAAQEAGHKKDGNRFVTPVDIITVARRSGKSNGNSQTGEGNCYLRTGYCKARQCSSG